MTGGRFRIYHLGHDLSKAERSEAWRIFCHPGTKLVECVEFRGTIMVRAIKLSPVRNILETNGAIAVRVISKLSLEQE